MAEKAIYSHGELDAVKKRLGPLSEDEARHMRTILGGEIGKERAEDTRHSPLRRQPGGKKPSRIVETVSAEADGASGAKTVGKKRPSEKPSFVNRVKMDILCGDPEFGIKSWFQVLKSRFSFFSDPPDKIAPYFVCHILNDYFNHLELLITQTRLLFPRNNAKLGEKLKSISPFSFKVLDVIRRWNLEVMSSEKSRLQRRAGNVFVADFSTFIYELYRPIYILECLEIAPHIETVYNTLYRILFLENASSETERKKELISKTIVAFQSVCRGMRRRFYPLFMKLVSTEFYFYDDFFIECDGNIQSFLGLTSNDHILPPKDMQDGEIYTEETHEPEPGEKKEEEPHVEEVEQVRTGNHFAEAEQKAFAKGITILDSLFPHAGWLNLEKYPDLIPYFSDVKSLPKGTEFIAPEDPAGIVFVLGSIIEELLYGFRKIQFTKFDSSEFSLDSAAELDSTFDSILDDWQKRMAEAFERHYLTRIQECLQLAQQANKRTLNSPYGVKVHSALHWTRRYYFFPYYDYKSNTPPPFKKSEINAFYPFVRKFRKRLTELAASIDKAMKTGGRERNVPVEGIKNPWEPYVFQIENPLSKRLGMLLAKNQRDNVSLLFFTLAIVTVLDDIMNDEGSFVYNAPINKMFRTGEDGVTPVMWIEKVSDTMNMFKNAVIERMRKQ